MPHALDNPVWLALTTTHAELAHGGRGAKVYAADVAPFIAVGTPDAPLPSDLVPSGDVRSAIGALPAFGSDWEVEARATLHQMVAIGPADPGGAGVGLVPLGDADAEAMLALTDLVFPGYFRRHTPRMGRYLGVKDGDRLLAMAGERLAGPGHREISGVCVHPEAAGRGYARALVASLVNLQRAEGLTPYLHVGPHNARAIALYRGLGFEARAELALCRARKK
jgi:ribosomal protein S18 acetylase RimI-like enzyme